MSQYAITIENRTPRLVKLRGYRVTWRWGKRNKPRGSFRFTKQSLTPGAKVVLTDRRRPSLRGGTYVGRTLRWGKSRKTVTVKLIDPAGRVVDRFDFPTAPPKMPAPDIWF